MRPIDADAVRDDFANTVYLECANDKDNNRANRIIYAFYDLPTIDAEPVRHGEWIGNDAVNLYCSECGKSGDYECDGSCKASLFCPNCGAIMDEM